MDIIDNISLYLPQYLSSNEKNALREELSSFPTDGTKDTIYSCAFRDVDYLLQGDGIKDVEYLSFPNTKTSKVPVLLLSNTCDMSTDNERMNTCRILFSPILKLEKYKDMLLKKYTSNKVQNHINDIKKQYISQIMYLPKGGKLDYEGIVFFDRAISIPLSKEIVADMCKRKLFTFSNFGFYLFLLKLSIHFTRIQEKIDRKSGLDLGNIR